MTMHNGTISEAAAEAWGVASGAPETQDIHVWIMNKGWIDGSWLKNLYKSVTANRAQTLSFSAVPLMQSQTPKGLHCLHSLSVKYPQNEEAWASPVPGVSKTSSQANHTFLIFSTVKRIVDARIRSLHVGQIRQVFPSFVRNGLPTLLMRFPLVSQIHQHHTTIKCINLYQSVLIIYIIILYWLPELMIRCLSHWAAATVWNLGIPQPVGVSRSAIFLVDHPMETSFTFELLNLIEFECAAALFAATIIYHRHLVTLYCRPDMARSFCSMFRRRAVEEWTTI